MTTVYVAKPKPSFTIGPGRPKSYKTEDGRKCLSVTTICNLWGDKGGLMRWYFDLGAADGIRSERGEQVLGFDGSGVKARDIGTAVHDAIQKTITTGKMAEVQKFGDEEQDKQAANAFANFRAFWSSAELEPESMEVPIVNGEQAVAGTHDLVARSARGKRIIIDWKTSKDFWPSNLIQLAAYGWLWEEDLRGDVDGYCLVLLPKEGVGKALWYSAAEMVPARAQWLRLVEAARNDLGLRELLKTGGTSTLDERAQLDAAVKMVREVFGRP